MRAVLSAIAAPTLVINHVENRYVMQAWSEHLASAIPDARLVLLPGIDHLYWIGDTRAILSEIEEFLTGVRAAERPDRVLATVLLTDIVGSTDHLSRLGDRSWRELLALHDAVVRRQLQRFRGQEIKATGDGFLATFDGPGRAIECALSITEAAHRLGVDVRTGLHTGEVELCGDDIAGLTVHIAQRVMSLAEAGEPLVSRTVTDLLAGSGITFVDRGEHELKGVPGRWRLFGVARG